MKIPRVKTLSIGFLILMTTLSSKTYSDSYEWSEKMKGKFRKGFLLTCEPVIKSQFERAGILDFATTPQRIAYCTCVAIKIFDDLTMSEVKSFQKSGELPLRKKNARSGYSNECSDKHF
jgi:hypothetical protein